MREIAIAPVRVELGMPGGHPDRLGAIMFITADEHCYQVLLTRSNAELLAAALDELLGDPAWRTGKPKTF